MENLFQFWALLVSIFGVFVSLFLMLLKISRNSVTKEDLKNAIDALRSEMNRRFEEAAADRAKIRAEMKEGFDEAAADRARIRAEMKEGFDEAAADRARIRAEIKEVSSAASMERKRIEEHAREARKEIMREVNRQNQNYIEHLAYHGSTRANPADEDDGKKR